ncbi:MAG: DNA polymerase III subunit delta [Candidatus Dojkabacteria bacterium]
MQANSGFEQVILDADSCEPQKIVNSYETVTMFSAGKLIFVKRLYNNKAKKELTESLVSYLESVPENVHIILWEDQKLASNLKYVKFFTSQKAIEEAVELNKRTFLSWAKEEFKSSEINCDKELLYSLCERVNFDPERFINEMEKLKLADVKTLTLEILQSNSKDTLESTIWELVDAINSQNKSESARVLERLLNQRADPIFIMSMLIRNNRMLIQVKHMKDMGADSREMAKELRIPPFTVPSLIKAVDGVEAIRLHRLHEKFYNLDYEIKTGRIEADMGLSLLTCFSL